jgi:3D (Asp-Asp-Asp) domain-containing protein
MSLRRLAITFVCAFCVASTVTAAPRRPVKRAAGRTIRVSATAYCIKGHTKSGVRAQHGIVAADPRLFPIGTTFRILAPGRPYAGIYTVMDTGASVKGREIDIFMPNCERAERFGRRSVRVRVIRRAPS